MVTNVHNVRPPAKGMERVQKSCEMSRCEGDGRHWSRSSGKHGNFSQLICTF